jgi:hypothetical protein
VTPVSDPALTDAEAFGQFQYPTPPLRRLDTTRIYREAYDGAGAAAGLTDDAAAAREAAAEFADEIEDGDL